MDNIVAQKRCTKCGKTGEFSTGRNVCKNCRKKYLREYNKLYYKLNTDEIKERAKRWGNSNPQKRRENGERWRKLNPERAKANATRWKNANSKRVEETLARWRKDHPTYNRKWQKAHPDNLRVYNSTRRALVNGKREKFSAKEWKDLCNKYGNKCLRCGRSDVKLTIDHVVPVFLGGKNVIDNIQCLCGSCNSKKHTKIVDYRPF